MRRAAAKCVLAGWVLIAVCMVTACSQAGSIKQAASSLASSVAANVTRQASTAAEAATTDSPSPTEAPTTAAGGGFTTPTSAAPSQPATSAAVPTSAPATTQAATTAAATPTPTATTGGTSSSVSPWVWVAIGAVALIALIAGIAAWTSSARRRRTAATSAWRNQLIDAYAKGAALYDAMAAAEVPGALSAPDAPARWYDIQRRADDYGQLLYRLRETTTDEQERTTISNVLASLQAARSAMEAERAARTADPSLAASVRDRLMYFSGSLSRLRQPDAGL
jgi:hypothetical protein